MLKKRLGSCIIALLLALTLLVPAVPTQQASAAPAFAKGADISWVAGMEAQGYKWKD